MASYNNLVNRTRLGTAIKNNLFIQFRELSKETRIPQSKLLDEAIEDLLKKYDKANATNEK